MTEKKTEFIIINETIPKSILKDTVSMVCMITVVYFSYHFDSALFSFFGLLIILAMGIRLFQKYKDENTFHTIDEVISRLQKMKAD